MTPGLHSVTVSVRRGSEAQGFLRGSLRSPHERERRRPVLLHGGPEGLSLKVRAKAGARSDTVVGQRAGELLVEVRAPAERGRANAEIARVLSKALGIPKDLVTLRIGGASHHKVFLLPLACRGGLEALCGKE